MAFVATAIAALGSAFGAGSLLTSFAGRLLTTVALSALSRALQPRPRAAGLRSDETLTGDLAPASFILGRSATAGSAICPALSHGQAGKTPNAWLTYVIALADGPGHRLERLWIDGEEAPITDTLETEHGYGRELGGAFAGRGWVRFHDGTQTEADPMLLATYGADPDRPWQADMIGRGLCYAILTFRYDREVYAGFPTLRFELRGAPLYDPRRDSTQGGSGPQRWALPATWEATENPVVMIYNILRGITLAPGRVWGPGLAEADLRRADWFAAMNLCDQEVPVAGGGTRPRYRAGWEVRTSDEPAAVIEELLKTCSGEIALTGSSWRIRAGGPGLPVYYLTDDDLLVTRPEAFSAFPPVDRIHNAISVTWPAPAHLYEMRETPLRRTPAWEAADGDRFLPVTLDLPACPHGAQAQRLGWEMIRDHRRMRSHGLTLGHPAAALECLDVIAWTSARNGYDAKAFDILEKQDEVFSAVSALSIREKNPADYDWQLTDELPDPLPSAVIRRPGPRTVPGFAAEGLILDDSAGRPRRPAIRLLWNGEALEDAVALEWELRRAGQTRLSRQGATPDAARGERILAGGLLPETVYEARLRAAFRHRKRAWTPWLQVVTPAVYLDPAEFGPGPTPLHSFLRARDITPVERVTALPGTPPEDPDALVNYRGQIHRWDGSRWTKAVDAADLTGQIDTIARFAQGIRPPEVLTALPATGNHAGRLVVLTTDGKLYRHRGSPAGAAGFTAAVDGADITAGTITAAALAAGAIGADQIAAGAITARSLAVGDLANRISDPLGQDLAQWAPNGPATGQVQLWSGSHVNDRITTGLALYTVAGQYVEVQNQSRGPYAIPRLAQGNAFAVQPGERYYLRATLHKAAGATAITAYLGLRVSNGKDTVSAYPRITASWTAAESGWREIEGILTIPDKVNGLPAALAVAHGGVANTTTLSGVRVLFGAMQLRRAAGGEMIVDGAISAHHLNTGSLAVAGVSVFGGQLASSDYLTGRRGWRVTQSGDAEFNSLIVRRGMLDIGAASIEASAYAGGALTKTGNTMAYGEDLLVIVSDAGLAGKPAWITYAAEVELTRSTIGWIEALFTLAGAVNLATYRARVHIPVADGVVRLPFMATRRITIPSGSKWEFASQPHMTNLPSGVTGSVKFSKRALILRANMDQ